MIYFEDLFVDLKQKKWKSLFLFQLVLLLIWKYLKIYVAKESRWKNSYRGDNYVIWYFYCRFVLYGTSRKMKIWTFCLLSTSAAFLKTGLGETLSLFSSIRMNVCLTRARARAGVMRVVRYACVMRLSRSFPVPPPPQIAFRNGFALAFGKIASSNFLACTPCWLGLYTVLAWLVLHLQYVYKSLVIWKVRPKKIIWRMNEFLWAYSVCLMISFVE